MWQFHNTVLLYCLLFEKFSSSVSTDLPFTIEILMYMYRGIIGLWELLVMLWNKFPMVVLRHGMVFCRPYSLSCGVDSSGEVLLLNLKCHCCHKCIKLFYWLTNHCNLSPTHSLWSIGSIKLCLSLEQPLQSYSKSVVLLV